jgi:hypothetical protein
MKKEIIEYTEQTDAAPTQADEQYTVSNELFVVEQTQTSRVQFTARDEQKTAKLSVCQSLKTLGEPSLSENSEENVEDQKKLLSASDKLTSPTKNVLANLGQA